MADSTVQDERAARFSRRNGSSRAKEESGENPEDQAGTWADEKRGENQTAPAVGQSTQESMNVEADKAQRVASVQARREKRFRRLQRALLRLLILLVIIWLLFFKIIGCTTMPNADMSPRIDAGDMLLYYRLDKTPASQDIIVFETTTPDSTSAQTFVGRVIAIAGDTVEITTDGHVVVNGNTLIEPGIYETTTYYEGLVSYPLSLSDGECFVLADAREDGVDSRYFGQVTKDEIRGTVIMLIRRNNL